MPRHGQAVGRYVRLQVDGVEYRVHYEEAGDGVPVYLQHTAGADSQQWRHLLEDRDLTARFRFIAPDLPFHGRSLPPDGVAWWQEEYLLRQAFFERFVVGFCRELSLDRPVYVGCSMGGHLAADLALSHPEEFRAFVGIAAALESHGFETLHPFLDHPRVGAGFKPSLMYTLTSPSAPEERRRETAWVYGQGAPPVFKGDLHYYGVEHDLTERAGDIDAARAPLWVLSGEYDWSAPPAAGAALAERVAGATHVVLEGMGHFPMSEDPERFREYVAPILEEAAAMGTAETRDGDVAPPLRSAR